MKKLLVLITFILAFSVFAHSQSMGFTVQGGYSWLNGLVGAEYQVGSIALSGGWFPTKMPGSDERISSFSGALTFYGGKWTRSSYYISGGVASAGYRSEVSYNGGAWTDRVVEPMYIVMLGYKGTFENVHCKFGLGYGWCDYAGVATWELTLGWTLFGDY